MPASLVESLLELERDHRWVYALVALATMLAAGALLTLLVEAASRVLGCQVQKTRRHKDDLTSKAES